MALADIVTRTRSVLYGQDLGAKPAMRLAASNANESISGDTVTFTLDSNEGAKVSAGDVLSVWDPDAEADAHAVYVLSISTDTITGVNGYLGSPAIVGADSGDLDDKVMEHNALATQFEIFEAIDTIFSHYLWPQVYDITQDTIASPNLVNGQEAVNAAAEEIINAFQVIGSDTVPVEFTRWPEDVNTSVKSTGRMATFEWFNGSTGYYAYKEKLAEADESGDELTHMVATGAAALLLGASLVETSLQSSKEHAAEQMSRRSSTGNVLWRDFLTLKQNFAETLGRRGSANYVLINRG